MFHCHFRRKYTPNSCEIAKENNIHSSVSRNVILSSYHKNPFCRRVRPQKNTSPRQKQTKYQLYTYCCVPVLLISTIIMIVHCHSVERGTRARLAGPLDCWCTEGLVRHNNKMATGFHAYWMEIGGCSVRWVVGDGFGALAFGFCTENVNK